MSQTLTEIAQQLRGADKKVQLIYAFNGAGKTRLSREFKELIEPKLEEEETEEHRSKVLYYNAFTEDLFYWDNDLEGDTERKLKIQPNAYTKWVLQDQGQDQNAISHFQHYTNEKLTPKFNANFSEVTFSYERGNEETIDKIKISKGEESIFIWSIFYSLIAQVIDILNVAEPSDRETDQYDSLKYIFIDDPVSSLDENHLIQLAVDLAQLIKSSDFTNGQGLSFIVSTHSPLFYNVLFSELKPGEGCILRRYDDGTFGLEKKQGGSNTSFSYHLHIKQLVEEAVEQNTVQRFHFTLLRNLYEKAASFLGYQQWSQLLPGDKEAYAKRIMHFYSHRSLSAEEVAEPTVPEKNMVDLLVKHLTQQHRFWQPGEYND